MTTKQIIHMDGFAKYSELQEVGIVAEHDGMIRLQDGSVWMYRIEYQLYELMVFALS